MVYINGKFKNTGAWLKKEIVEKANDQIEKNGGSFKTDVKTEDINLFFNGQTIAEFKSLEE